MFRSVWVTHAAVATGQVLLSAPPAHALDAFVDATSALQNDALTSGVSLGVADLNGDGRDDIVRLDQGRFLEIEHQNEDGSFSRSVFGAVSLLDAQWSMAIADIDGNGFGDIFLGGPYDGLKVLLASADGSRYAKSDLGGPDIFVQCSNWADIDNNGTLDLFVCHDEGLSSVYSGDGAGNLGYAPTLFDTSSTIASDNSGNYGTVWTDYDNDGDLDMYLAKCRAAVVAPLDGRRVNMLFENDGSGKYTDVAESRGLRPLTQTWSADFGDIDNDGDLDAFLISHDVPSQLFENDGSGNFSDVTAAAGLSDAMTALGFGIQGHFADFDNDGFLDLVVSGIAGDHLLLLGHGDGSFTRQSVPFPTSRQIQSLAVGDLNDDGFIDVLAAFADDLNTPSDEPDRLLVNPGNENGFIDVILRGSVSNATGVGARVELHGSWGMQIREVRAGEGYGVTHSATRHFGIGRAASIDRVVVRWPSGTEDTLSNPTVNSKLFVDEGCMTSWYADGDGDGHGNPDDVITDCLAQQGYAESSDDCDDENASAAPGLSERCDGADNDCDGDIDEGLQDCMFGAGGMGGAGGGATTANPDTVIPGGGCRCSSVGHAAGGLMHLRWLWPAVVMVTGLRRRRCHD